MPLPDSPAMDGNAAEPTFGAFAPLISSLSARLAGATGDAVQREVNGCLGELLAFFGVDQCGIIEVQPDIRQARLRYVAHVPDVIPATTTLEYGAAFPWTHEKTVIRGESFVQTCIDDLPAQATVDRASCAAMGLHCLVTIPVGIGGRITHVLCLTSRKTLTTWPSAILSMLKTVAETFLAVITRHNTEIALQSSMQSLAEAQRVAGVGSYVCDWRDDTLTGSEVANRIFGIELEGAARDILERVHAQDLPKVREGLGASLADPGRTLDLEYRIVRRDGAVRIIRSSMRSVLTPAGTPLQTLVTIQDVSDLRAAEQERVQLRSQLLHVDRAAHLGALTASLSHELNQPLTGILANAQAVLQRLNVGQVSREEMREVLEAIVRDDKRAAGVIGHVRAMLRREEAPRARFDLAYAITEVLALFRSELDARRVTIQSHVDGGLFVFGDRAQIQQVFVNLLANAIEALADGLDGERRLELSLSHRNGSAVATVRDNGCGIPADRLTRIFEPFFTTRADGLGMGLAISRSIVEAHGGEIRATNNRGGGSTFRVDLPAQPSARIPLGENLARADSSDAMAASDERAIVCVVDDDAASRGGVGRLLSAAGWRVATFESAAAALASDRIRAAHCLVLDVQMPTMSGLALHGELLRRGVDAPAIFVTARGDAATGVQAMKGGALEYLTKPVDEAILLDAVRKAVARHAEQANGSHEREELKRRMAKLTRREREVMRSVIEGRLNKQIAADLTISEATVKQHRGQVMAKMQVRSIAELVRVCQKLGFSTDT